MGFDEIQIGDLVAYPKEAAVNEIPGIVVGFTHHTDDDPNENELLLVQWFDWNYGDLAKEHPDAVLLVSKAE